MRLMLHTTFSLLLVLTLTCVIGCEKKAAKKVTADRSKTAVEPAPDTTAPSPTAPLPTGTGEATKAAEGAQPVAPDVPATDETPAETPAAPPPTETTPPPAAPSPEPPPPVKETETVPSTPPPTVTGEAVMLGAPDLTAGIPGDGPLTVEQIQAWLDRPENHVPLTFMLPLGISGATPIVPVDNPLTRAKIELGRQLYLDGRLSADGSVSCASCHDPAEGYGKRTQFGVGIGDQTGNRNSPISYNRIVSGAQFWDGRAASLEEQAKGPIANPIEMGNTHDAAVDTVKKIEGYRLQFDKVFPGEGITIDTIAKAIATFERTLVTGPTPYDYYEPLRNFEIQYADDLQDLETLKSEEPELYEQYMAMKKASDEHPMSDSARRGRELFFTEKANCTACHAGANFTDEQYHNLGVGMDQPEPDLGRFVVTNVEKDKGAFKTPTIRNVTLSAPYMHDGSQKTLEEVVEWYAKGGHPNPYLSDKMKKLELSDQDKADLVAFMQALEGSFPTVETGRLPQSP